MPWLQHTPLSDSSSCPDSLTCLSGSHFYRTTSEYTAFGGDRRKGLATLGRIHSFGGLIGHQLTSIFILIGHQLTSIFMKEAASCGKAKGIRELCGLGGVIKARPIRRRLYVGRE
jgi:hypothetical protein